MIVVDSYIVGTPTFAVAGGGFGFVRMLTEKWFRDFAVYCDLEAEARMEMEPRDAESLTARPL